MQQDHRLLQFMMKLNDRFATVRGNILMQQPLPTLSNAFRVFSQEERHQEFSQSTSQNETLAFMVDGRKGFHKQGNFQKQPGFKGNSNSKGGSYFCTNCKMSGHTVDRYFKLHGYPPNFKNSKDKLQQLPLNQNDHALLADKLCLTAEKSDKGGWLIDSGAIDHICSDLSLFHNYKSVEGTKEYITIPDGRQIPIVHTGSVTVHPGLVLHNVLHIPQFQFNLLSVQRICKDLNSTVVFNGNTCFLQDHLLKESPILLGKFQGGLYSTSVVHDAEVLSKSSFLSFKDDIRLWHLRLGHVPFTRMKHISGLSNVKDSTSNFICQICPLARQARNSFSHSEIKSTVPFELVHIDVWGPYKVKSYSGCNQFLTIVDDYSRFTWVHMLKNRTDCVKVFKDFIAHVATQYSAKIVKVKSDNAPELCQGLMKELFLQQGIFHQTTCSYTPQQNGVVERKHRHLLETGRALFFQSKIPEKYWSENILCAAYILNRIPLQSIHNDTPYYRLTGNVPDLSHFRVFVSLCFASTISKHRTKFEPRAIACVFLGYAVSQKGYKVFDFSRDTVFVSRDLVFHETHFPFYSQSLPTDYPATIYLPSVTSFYDSDDTINFPSTPSSDPQSVGSGVPNSVPSTTPTSVTTSNSFSVLQDLSTDESLNVTTELPVIRKSTRIHKTPSYLSSYKCNTVVCSTHWCNLVKTPSIQPACTIKEPLSYKEAANNPVWIAAMQKELEALHTNNTWDLVPLPANKKPIGSKWVFKVKLKSDGSLERCKARLVAKGYNQKHGIDYQETFSPVVKMSTVRILLALAASRNWELHQLDVNNAFLHGTLKEVVYMQVPDGVPNPHNLVCLLRKSIYGLKQASREWHAKLVEELICQGFMQSKNDYSLFIKRQGSVMCIAAVYVDDVILTGDDLQAIHSLKQHLDSKFGIKDLGDLHFFLGIEVTRTASGIVLSQQKFANELLLESGFDNSSHTITPLPVHLKLSLTDGDLIDQPNLYRSLIGYLTNTRPDLSYTVQVLSQFMHSPRFPHLVALKHTLRYLAGTVTQGILLQASDRLTLQAFSDVDWASCIDTRRSVTGYILLFGNSPVTWKSKKQNTVSRSSAEVEYRAMASAAAEVTWVVRLLSELGVNALKPVVLHCDNQSALHIAQNPVFHERTKHIELDCHFNRDKVLEGLLQLTYLPTRSQIADVFTKVSPSVLFNSLLSKLGVSPSPALRGMLEYTLILSLAQQWIQHTQTSSKGNATSALDARGLFCSILAAAGQGKVFDKGLRQGVV
ncbi:hypothetical protein AgCh_008493 [Apium graveolens]